MRLSGGMFDRGAAWCPCGLRLIGCWGADGLTRGATFCFFGLEGAQAALSFENLLIGRGANCPSIAMETDLGHLSLKLGKSKVKFGDDCFVVHKALSSLAIRLASRTSNGNNGDRHPAGHHPEGAGSLVGRCEGGMVMVTARLMARLPDAADGLSA